MKPSIELHIEELVLHGFASRDQYRIAEALERELAGLFSEQTIPPALLNGGEVAHLNAGAVQVHSGARPDAIGAQVARAVFKELGVTGANRPRPLSQSTALGETSGGTTRVDRERGRGL
jgi:hypothetical protein